MIFQAKATLAAMFDDDVSRKKLAPPRQLAILPLQHLRRDSWNVDAFEQVRAEARIEDVLAASATRLIREEREDVVENLTIRPT